jgi:hypothetical protein
MANGSGIVVTETYLDGIVLSDPPTDGPAALASTGYVTKSNCDLRLRRHLRCASRPYFAPTCGVPAIRVRTYSVRPDP